jgi:hypothetical protein
MRGIIRLSLGAVMVAGLSCGGKTVKHDDDGVGDGNPDQPLVIVDAAPLPEPAPWVWEPNSGDIACTDKRCGEPYEMVVEFDSADELKRAGWRYVNGTKQAPSFAGGVWTAAAGEYDEFIGGPSAWAKVADRMHGWAVTAVVEVSKDTPGCTVNNPGTGLRVSGALGTVRLYLYPDAIQTLSGKHDLSPSSGQRTFRVEFRDGTLYTSVDGVEIATGRAESYMTAPSAIEFGQLGCTEYTTRWDKMILEAGIYDCTHCNEGENPMIARVRQRLEALGAGGAAISEVDTSNTARAYPRCIAYAALDHAVRDVVAAALEDAGQRNRAAQVLRLDPVVDTRGLNRAATVLVPMGVPLERPGCDPVHSASDCDFEMPHVEPIPPIVAAAKAAFPHSGWYDYTAAGLESMLDTATAIHEQAGPNAVAELLERLSALSRPGGGCSAE